MKFQAAATTAIQAAWLGALVYRDAADRGWLYIAGSVAITIWILMGLYVANKLVTGWRPEK